MVSFMNLGLETQHSTAAPKRLKKVRSVHPQLLSLLLLIFALSGCSHSESNEVDQQRRAALSWAATAVMTLDAWGNGAVPSHFARRTCQTVREHIFELTKKSPGLRFQNEMRQISETLGQAEAHVAALDHEAVKRSRNALAEISSSLRALKRSP